MYRAERGTHQDGSVPENAAWVLRQEFLNCPEGKEPNQNYAETKGHGGHGARCGLQRDSCTAHPRQQCRKQRGPTPYNGGIIRIVPLCDGSSVASTGSEVLRN
ncbi:MAG: hypothetical protein COZ06_34945 [Armatimonadetes bacterium CG_4_10_14_3_um_filter_66_18]|nr:MAG: hypothetical protein COZ06_34945 [Armatimonadetes bacterium CG_4_10_14_3_um_filter_66_18]